MKFLTKKRLVVFSLVIIALFILGIHLFDSFCSVSAHGYYCRETLSLTFWAGVVTITLFILSFPFTPPLSSLVFERWKRFAVWGIPLSVVLMLWIESSGSSGGLPGQFHPGLIFYPLILAIYFAISFTVILGAWYEAKTNKKPRKWQYAISFLLLLALCITGLFYAASLLI